ncbi:MAG: prolyl-tRNA synthetase [Rhodocyclaceae bacterium]|nr:prolyl-tRNA synthetase [Rhodocyclaceae bacterium]
MDMHTDSDTRARVDSQKAATLPASKAEGKKKPISMHEGIAVWCDCCSCEAEPRWVEVANEMGIDLGDYEDEDGREKPQGS